MRGEVAAVLFDLDGTLVDHAGVVAAALRAWLPSYGLSADAIEAVTPLWFDLEQRHYRAWRSGEISFEEQRRRRIRDFMPAVGALIPLGQLDGVFAEYLRCYASAWAAFEDAAPALRRIASAGLRVGVLTNGDYGQQTAKLAATGLIGLCGPVFASSELSAGKPDRRAYLVACRRLGVLPGRVLMVGDDHELDVVAARAAGLSAVLLDRSGSGSQPVAGIGSLRDLLPA
ncbi:MAG TPA: HAD family hydrolase [Streptosporangiaceae bacterium]|nr:HAD family hydrolase [Streptosporangiaceae bacterium]